MNCPFCGNDPYHYVHNGLGYEPVAVDCCDLGYDLLSRHGNRRSAWRLLGQMRSYSPRKKARAMRALREHGLRPPNRSERRASRRKTP